MPEQDFSKFLIIDKLLYNDMLQGLRSHPAVSAYLRAAQGVGVQEFKQQEAPKEPPKPKGEDLFD